MISSPGITPHLTHVSSYLHGLQPPTKTPSSHHSFKVLSSAYEQGAWEAQVTLGPDGQGQPFSMARQCPCLSHRIIEIKNLTIVDSQFPVPVPHTELSGEIPNQGVWEDAPKMWRGQKPFFRPGFIYTKEETVKILGINFLVWKGRK